MLCILIRKENVYCVYSLEWPHRSHSNEYTQHTITLLEKKILNYPFFAFKPCGMINPKCLEQPMSKTIPMVPKMFESLKVGCLWYCFVIIIYMQYIVC